MTTRRKFITLLGGAAAWPLAARAQQPAMPVIGFLHPGSPEPRAHLVAALHQGLSEIGFVERQDVAMEYRWARDRWDRLPELAADLVRSNVKLIIAVGGDGAALAAKNATARIPIVFNTASDPLKLGLIASFNRPGGNVTGVAFINTVLAAKRLGLLHELVPMVRKMGVLVNPNNSGNQLDMPDAEAAARSLGTGLQVLSARTKGDLEEVFAGLAQQEVNALLISTSVQCLRASVGGSDAPAPQHVLFENDLAVDGVAIAGIDLGRDPKDGLAKLFKFSGLLFTVRAKRRGLVAVRGVGVRQNLPSSTRNNREALRTRPNDF